MKYYLQVITGKSSLLSPSVYLFFDTCRYLFNTGEGLQRFMLENKIRNSKLTHIFITGLDVDKICALPCMMLNLSDSVEKKRTVHGPEGLLDYTQSFFTFAYDKFFTFVEYSNQNSTNLFFRSTTERNFTDENVNIKIIPLQFNGKTGMVYIVECKKIGVKFNSEKLKELNIKGKMVKELQDRGSIQVAGKTVLLSDVTFPPIPQPIIVIFDVPDSSLCEPLVEQLSVYLSPEYDLQLFVHFTGKEVVLTPSYISFLHNFPGTQNTFLDIIPEPGPVPFKKSNTLLHKLNGIYSKVFPVPYFPQSPDTETLELLSQSVPNLIIPKSLTKVVLSPPLLKGLDHSEETSDPTYELPNLELKTWPSKKCDYHDIINTQMPGSDPQLLFLGTASMKPGNYRNVSGIHFSMWGGGMLLDCGEGSYYQLVRSYGAEIENVLADLKIILVSHMHADHHSGILKLLYERRKVTKDPLVIIGPSILNLYLGVCSRLMGPFYYSFSTPQNIEFGQIKIEVVPVDHKIEAYGFVVSHVSGWKLVYSGDTRPCPELIQAGFNATVLIHEATFDDMLEEMAINKFHSTLSQAISVASAMEVWKVVLTHFSQRYSKIPENMKVDTIFTFDLMKFRFSDCTKLANIMPTLLEEWGSDEDSETN